MCSKELSKNLYYTEWNNTLIQKNYPANHVYNASIFQKLLTYRTHISGNYIEYEKVLPGKHKED